MSFKIDHVRSKTKLQGQILEKPCVRSRCLIISPILMKLDQKVCLGAISEDFENGLCWVKNKITTVLVLFKFCINTKYQSSRPNDYEKEKNHILYRGLRIPRNCLKIV